MYIWNIRLFLRINILKVHHKQADKKPASLYDILTHKSIYRCAATNCLNHNLWLRVYDGLHIIYFLLFQFLYDRVCKYIMQSRWDYYDMQLIADGCKIIVAWTYLLSRSLLHLWVMHRIHFHTGNNNMIITLMCYSKSFSQVTL